MEVTSGLTPSIVLPTCTGSQPCAAPTVSEARLPCTLRECGYERGTESESRTCLDPQDVVCLPAHERHDEEGVARTLGVFLHVCYDVLAVCFTEACGFHLLSLDMNDLLIEMRYLNTLSVKAPTRHLCLDLP